MSGEKDPDYGRGTVYGGKRVNECLGPISASKKAADELAAKLSLRKNSADDPSMMGDAYK